MDARRRGGSKFPEIDVFGDVYVRPGNELAESLHTTMVERSQLVLQESASQLPPETSIESSSQVTALTAQVATLQSQMSMILESLARSGIPIPQFHTATSEPVQPEHPQQTTAP
ncbi:unnamed protein product, partial [Prunus brigantina]